MTKEELQNQINKLEQENEELYDRLRVFDVFLAEEDATERFIASTKMHMEIHDEVFPDTKYDWAIEKQMIREYQEEVDSL